MSGFDDWAKAIDAECTPQGQLTLCTVISHIRCAVVETGFISRGRILNGLKEAYRPLETDGVSLKENIDDALRLLLLSGDLDEFSTPEGRGYTVTPPRRVEWGASQVALLGAFSDAHEKAIVRRASTVDSDQVGIVVTLASELGRPGWRTALVDLQATDLPAADASALFAQARMLAASGERYTIEDPRNVAILSGRGRFFGQAENAPSGRWERPPRDGCFPAVIGSGYARRYVVLSISGNATTLWQPPSRDLWYWVVIGATLAARDPPHSYDSVTHRLDFLTPPPLQIQRAALLTGIKVGPWSWEVDAEAFGTIASLTLPQR